MAEKYPECGADWKTLWLRYQQLELRYQKLLEALAKRAQLATNTCFQLTETESVGFLRNQLAAKEAENKRLKSEIIECWEAYADGTFQDLDDDFVNELRREAAEQTQSPVDAEKEEADFNNEQFRKGRMK